MAGPANCSATRYGRSRIRIQSKTMQLGLRFAAAKLPGLRSSRGGGPPWSQAVALVPRGATVDSGALPSPIGRSAV